jgi:hypothetical protein
MVVTAAVADSANVTFTVTAVLTDTAVTMATEVLLLVVHPELLSA